MSQVTLSFWSKTSGTEFGETTLPIYGEVTIDVMKAVVNSVPREEAIEIFKERRTHRWYRRHGSIVVQM